MVELEVQTISETALADRQAGRERFSCGCVLDALGRLEEECPNVVSGADEARALIRHGWGMSPAERTRLDEIQEGLASHVRKARAATKKGKDNGGG
ncbi:MAG: hypothetical protein IPG34_19760 [Rhodocyclaceae bacterium]|nr:hypothetical protein [Rhodocyclaceae bacterium]